MRRFSFFQRNGIFYCQLFNPETSRFGTAKSTGCRNRDDAVLVVADWLREGVPTGYRRISRPVNEAFSIDAVIRTIRSDTFNREDASRVLKALGERGFIAGTSILDSTPVQQTIDYLTTFWDENASDYIRSERARGRTIPLRHIREMRRLAERYWSAVLGDTKLGTLKRADVQSGLVQLAEAGGSGGKPLAPGTIGKAFACISTAMKWAHEQELIQHNPCAGVRRTVGATKERGILSESEISALVSHTWSDERARMAFLLALTTGLRLGEVIALQVRDIGTDRLYIRHSWNDDDRLKAPKNGKTREAVILPQVREGLLSLVHSNPYGSSQSTFLFYGGQQDRPLDGQALSRMFDDALVQIEMGDAFNSAQLEIRKSVLKSIRSGDCHSIPCATDLQKPWRTGSRPNKP
jgi:integrase